MKGTRKPKAALHRNKKTRKSCRRRLQLLQLTFSPTTPPAGEKADHINSSTSSNEYSSDHSSSRRGGEHQAMNTGGGAERPSSSSGSRIGNLVYGHASVMGRRRTMEDKVTVAPPGWMAGEYYFFAVYDGHGGDKVAEKCREEMHTCLERQIEKVKKLPAEERDVDWEKVMVDCFSSMDEEIDRNHEVAVQDGEDAAAAYKNMGSTVAVLLVGREEIVVAG